jgi:hypothetical protein
VATGKVQVERVQNLNSADVREGVTSSLDAVLPACGARPRPRVRRAANDLDKRLLVVFDFLDGRDPNSFANVAWIFGQHDRAGPNARSTARSFTYQQAAWSAGRNPNDM